jgi:DNA-directed RNA polymerase subunit beta'
MIENESVTDMINSGSRGSKGNMSAMAGMKGIVSNVLNQPIEFPVKSSIKEGLDPIEYFIATHGSRKGLADTALNTARAGYLTRRLFDAGQDVIIKEKSCGTDNSILISTEGEGFTLPFIKTVKGRYLAENVKVDGKTIFKKGHFITHLDAEKLDELGVKEVRVKSPMTCESENGICQECYGMDMGGDQLVDLGEPVGTIAAQAIGEPGTQLTMRTFHNAGAASKEGDITMGLPRVEEIFERRKPKIPAIISRTDGEVSKIEKDGQKTLVTVYSKNEAKKEKIYVIPYLRELIVKEGDKLSKGDFLTDGAADISELLKYGGPDRAKEYIISETVKIYELQGSSVARKHIEVIIAQMFSRSKVIDSGDSDKIEGAVLENSEIAKINEELRKAGKKEMETELLVVGIAEVSLSRKS